MWDEGKKRVEHDWDSGDPPPSTTSWHRADPSPLLSSSWAAQHIWMRPRSHAFPPMAFQALILIIEVLYSWRCSKLSLRTRTCIRIRNRILS